MRRFTLHTLLGHTIPDAEHTIPGQLPLQNTRIDCGSAGYDMSGALNNALLTR
jgi:hypothetical protein